MSSQTRRETAAASPSRACLTSRAVIGPRAYATRASGLSAAAVRRADALARIVVAKKPTTRTTPPQAVSIHQPGWLAAESPDCAASPTLDATIAPTTATPSVCPTWRDVVAIADATPA